MATHASAIKRHRQSLKRRDRNRVARATVRTAIKKTIQAAQDGNVAEAKKLLVEAESALGKAASKGLFHKNNATRRISRLAQLVAKASA